MPRRSTIETIALPRGIPTHPPVMQSMMKLYFLFCRVTYYFIVYNMQSLIHRDVSYARVRIEKVLSIDR